MNKPIEAKEFRLNPDGSECDDATYMERCNLLRFLKNDHYTNWQIRLFKSLIVKGDSYEKIKRLFTPEASAEEIEEYLRETKIKV